MNSIPLFSVIIPTYHRNDLLAKCLDCLAPGVQTLPPEQYEVIITDDGFQTTAEELIRDRYPWAKWVAGSRQGPAANRNNGARYAKGEWLVFTDDDCLPDLQWLEAYGKAVVTEPSCLVFEGRTYVDRPRRSLAEISPTNESGGCLWSCNFAIQQQLFESISGFDERFPYAAMEDVDLSRRLKKTGYSFSFVKTASVCHPWKPKGGWHQLQQYQESILIYLAIHPEESVQINSQYYLVSTLRIFIKITLPGLFQFRGAGLKKALLEHFKFLQMALILWLKFGFKGGSSHSKLNIFLGTEN
jgi:GT2 family glycosyltransferase